MKRVKENDFSIKKRNFALDIPCRPVDSGDLLVCGAGDMGQLGLGENINERKRPTLVPGLSAIVDVVAGGMHSLALTSDGKVYSFGCNDEGALGRICSKDFPEFVPYYISLPGKVVKISAGDSHSACLLEDGRVFSWGSFRDSHGNMGLTLEGNQLKPINILPHEICCSIASGSDHFVMLTTKGKVFTVGCGEQGQLGRVSLRSASGDGRRGKSQLLCPGEVYNRGNLLMSEIWATSYATFMRSINDTIWAFGLNNYKQLMVPKDLQTIIKPMKLNLSDVKAVAGGQHHTIILKNDGKCYTFGRSDYGRLGIGQVSVDYIDLQCVVGLEEETIIKIAAGEAVSFALTATGKIYAWGMGSTNQLGLGDDNDAFLPTLLQSKQTLNKRILGVSSGGQHTIFIVEPKIKDKKRETTSPMPTDISVSSTTVINKKFAVLKKVKAAKEVNHGAISNGNEEIKMSHNNEEILTNSDNITPMETETAKEAKEIPVMKKATSPVKASPSVRKSPSDDIS